MDIAIHCLPDDNTNTIIEDSIYFHFFELPSDLERIRKWHGVKGNNRRVALRDWREMRLPKSVAWHVRRWSLMRQSWFQSR